MLYLQLNVVSQGELRIKNYTEIFNISEFFYFMIYATTDLSVLIMQYDTVLHLLILSFNNHLSHHFLNLFMTCWRHSWSSLQIIVL